MDDPVEQVAPEVLVVEHKRSLLFHPQEEFSSIIRNALRSDIDSGKIGTIDASSAEGTAIANELMFKSVPQCIEKKDGKYVLCKLSDLLEEK